MDARQIQTALNTAGFGPLAVDGDIGPGTVAAIKQFQRAHGLQETGNAGPKTTQFLLAVLGQGAAPTAPGGLLTAAVLRKVCPSGRADLIDAIVTGAPKLAATGITTALIAAHFLAQVATETVGLRAIEENLNYSAERLMAVWPRRFPTRAAAEPYAFAPQALAGYVYGGRLGNTSPSDGWRYRGGGMLQTTGRANYAAAGYEGNPEALRSPVTALEAALHFWTSHNLNRFAASDDLVGLRKAINGGTNGLAEARAYLAKAKAAL